MSFEARAKTRTINIINSDKHLRRRRGTCLRNAGTFGHHRSLLRLSEAPLDARSEPQATLIWPVHTASPSTPLLFSSSTSSPCSPSFPSPSSNQTSSPNSYPSCVPLSFMIPSSFGIPSSKLTLRADNVDPLVAARLFWGLLPRISRLGRVHVSRLSRCLSRVAQGETFISSVFFHGNSNPDLLTLVSPSTSRPSM